MIRLAFATERISWKAWNILPRLTEEFEITLITYSTPDEIPSGKFHRIISIPTPRHEMLPTTGWRISALIDRLHREGQIDFAYVYSSIAYLIRSCPYVNVMNGSFADSCLLCLAYAPGLRKARAVTGFFHYVVPEIAACKRADRVITVSGALKDLVCRRYGREPEDVSIVHNGLGEECRALYDEKKLSRDPPSVLFTGRLHFQKGILDLVKAFVAKPTIPARFYICGAGPDAGELARLAARDTRICLLGHVDRQTIMRCLRNTSLYLFPSLSEGFGLSLTEAMASGHACLVYDIPVNRELLGDAGIYVPYNRPSLMVEALEDCVARRAWLRRKAQDAFEQAKKFSWSRCGDEMTMTLKSTWGELSRKGTISRRTEA